LYTVYGVKRYTVSRVLKSHYSYASHYSAGGALPGMPFGICYFYRRKAMEIADPRMRVQSPPHIYVAPYT
jgi:hypothetical protein